MKKLLLMLILMLNSSAMVVTGLQYQDISDSIDESEAQIIFSLNEGFEDVNKSLDQLNKSLTELNESVIEVNTGLQEVNTALESINTERFGDIFSMLGLISAMLFMAVLFVVLGFIMRVMVK